MMGWYMKTEERWLEDMHKERRKMGGPKETESS
jgi:hypothetical protein